MQRLPRYTVSPIASHLIRILFFLGFACSSLYAAKIVIVDHRIFPGLAAMDGHWAALSVAHDGKVYIGLAYH
jgi:hypothetical protein